MAQHNFAEEINLADERLQINNVVIAPTDVMTGDRNQSRFLYYQLKMSMMKAKGTDIIVSFLMESGVRMILQDLKNALDRGVSVRILTGNYLGITQPSALYMLKKELVDRV
ncbi:MAG: NgoFVII family restriction endonuclease, partial [Lachnospiraceae bacterium]|nr:NgoFVII family restriction endonuclease [Lachnospiraceae bacterium]